MSSPFAQAIVLDQGQYTVGVSYQHTFVRYHIGWDGAKYDLGHITSYSIQPQVSYGVTDRIKTVAYAFPRGLNAYAGYFATVWARTAHQNAGPILGFTWSPRAAPSWLARKRHRQPVQIARR